MILPEVAPMRLSLSVLLVFVVLLLAHPVPAQKQSVEPDGAEPPAYTVDEGYEVYSSILQIQATSVDQLVVVRETEPYKMCLAPSAEPNAAIRAAMVDYMAANQAAFTLQANFQVSKPYTLVSRQELNLVFRQKSNRLGDHWALFRRMYPNSGGIRTFSAVGFNGDKSFALVYYSDAGNDLSGTGGILVLQKVDGKWKELPSKMMCRWIS